MVVIFGYMDYTEGSGHWYQEDHTHKFNILLSSTLKEFDRDECISIPCNSYRTATGPI